MPNSVTISIPVTARFDGCFCSETCNHYYQYSCWLFWTHTNTERVGCPQIDLHRAEWMTELDNLIRMSRIRTRWCCETFGMGEQEQEQRDTIADGVELETMDAKDAEALRRWIQK